MSSTSTLERLYVRQCSAALVLSVYTDSRPADPCWVLSEREVTGGGWRVRIQIVGASHVAVIERGGTAFTEMLVARPVRAALPEAFAALPAGVEGDVVLDAGGWAYSCARRSAAARPDALETWCIPLQAGGFDTLWRDYPPGPAGRAGTTALAWRFDGSHLSLETFHSYPDEARLVLTHTRCRGVK